jgi:hypothetical protein
MVIDGTPEELILHQKLSREWDLFYGELKARGIPLSDVLTSRSGENADDFLNLILRGGDKKKGKNK